MTSKPGRIINDDYELLERIGCGAQGVVWKARKLSSSSSSSSSNNSQNDNIVAIKIIDIHPLNEKQKDLALTEVRVLSMMSSSKDNTSTSDGNSSSLYSPCIMNYIDSFLTEYDELCLVLEWAAGGTLADWLRRRKDHLDADKMMKNNSSNTTKQRTDNVKTRKNPISPLLARFIWSVLISVSCALDHCQSQKIMHRDLKPENIFLSSKPPTFFEDEEEFLSSESATDKNVNNEEQNPTKPSSNTTGVATKFPRCLLGDFGVSCVLDSKTSASTMIGSPYFLSPSVCKGEKYDYKSDIWSLGVCGFLLVNNNRFPFEASNYAALILKIVQNRPADHDVNAFSVAMMSSSEQQQQQSCASSSSAVISTNTTKTLLRLQKSPTFQLRDFVDSCLVKSVQLRPTAHDLLTRRFTVLMASQLGLLHLYPQHTKAAAMKVLGQVHQSNLIKQQQQQVVMNTTTTTIRDEKKVSHQPEKEQEQHQGTIKNVGRRRSLDYEHQKNLQIQHDKDQETNDLMKLLPSSSAPATNTSSFNEKQILMNIAMGVDQRNKNDKNTNDNDDLEGRSRPQTTTTTTTSARERAKIAAEKNRESATTAVGGGGANRNKFGVIKTKRMIQQERINNRLDSQQQTNSGPVVVDIASSSSPKNQVPKKFSPASPKNTKKSSKGVPMMPMRTEKRRKENAGRGYAQIHGSNNIQKTGDETQSTTTKQPLLIKSTRADKQSVKDLPDNVSRASCSSSDDDVGDDNNNNNNNNNAYWGAPLSATDQFAQHANVTSTTTQPPSSMQSSLYSMQANPPASVCSSNTDDEEQQEEEEFLIEDEDEDEDEDEEELEPFGSTVVNVSWRIRDDTDEILDDENDDDEDDRLSIISGVSSAANTTTTTSAEYYNDQASLASQVDLCLTEGKELVGEDDFAKLVEIVRKSKDGNEIEKSIEGLRTGASVSAEKMKEAVHCAFRMCLLDAVLISEGRNHHATQQQQQQNLA